MRKLPLVVLLASLVLSACTGTTAKDENSQESSALENGGYALLADQSSIYWEARKPIGGHMGTIDLIGGEIIVQEGLPSSGSFKIDTTSIRVTDQEGALATRIANHLKSDDFFSSATYPEARFDITRAKVYEGFDGYTHELEGDLSLKGVTASVNVLANIEETETGLWAEADVVVDRTVFDIKTRSGSFFENLGDQLIEDEFTLEMELVARSI